MLKFYISFLLIIILIIIPLSKSDIGDVVGTSIPDKVSDEYKKTLGSNSESSSSSSKGSGGSSVKNYYTNTATNAILVNTHTDYSRVEDGLPLYGEVGITKEFRNSLPKAISGLTICERIDDNVDLVKEPVCYLSYFGNKSSKIMSDLKDNITIDAKNDTSGEFAAILNDENTRSFYIPYLGPKGRIIVYYKIISKNEGTVNLATSVRFNEKDYYDEDHDFKFKSEFPVDVIANVQKSRLFTGWLSSDDLTSTSIIYDLEYRNASSKVNNKSVNITIEGKSDYYEIKRVTIGDYNLGSNQALDKKYDYQRNNIGDLIKFTLPFGKNNRISMIVDYFYEGENNIPYLFLDNARFPKDHVKISVEDYLNSISSVIYLVIINTLALIASCIIAFFTYRTNNKNKQNRKNEFIDHRNELLDRIRTSSNSIQWEISQMRLNLNAINDKMDDITGFESLKEIALELREMNKKFK